MAILETELFTTREIGRIVRLRDRYAAGRWPRPFAETSKSELFPIEMRAEFHTEETRTLFNCTLTRIESAPTVAPMQVSFQTPRDDDPAPDADEVLRWLALGAVDLDNAEVTGHLAIMFQLMTSPPLDLAYRGLVVASATIDEFELEMASNATTVANLIGDKALAYLVKDLIKH